MLRISSAQVGRTASLAGVSAASTVTCKRHINELVHNGRGGRSSVDGVTVTVFGATGHVGRYLVNELGKRGTQLVIPYRGDEMHFRHLRQMGDIGQVTFMEYDIRDYGKVKEAVQYSDVVFNLAGRDYVTRNFSLNDINVQGARNVARACRDAGVERLIHVSALGASSQSPSAFLRSKASGEKAVRDEFPTATIVRPAQVFSPEDKLLNLIGMRMAIPGGVFFANPDAARYPVYCPDVGRGLAACVRDDRAPGNTFEFVGPERFTWRELATYVLRMVREQKTRIYKMPMPILQTAGYFQELNPLYAPMFTRDTFTREALSEEPEGLPGLADLGIKDTTVGQMGIKILRQYRKHVFHDDHIEDKDTKVPHAQVQ